MTTTYNLLDLRREVARRLGDYFGNPTGVGAATPTTGGTNNIIDTGRGESNGYFNGAYFVGKVGGGSPVYGRVNTYTSSTHTFNLLAALSSSCTTSDNYELYKLFSPDEYTSAINAAIREVAAQVRIEATPDTSLALVYNQCEYAVPSGFSTLHRVALESALIAGFYEPLEPWQWGVSAGLTKVRLDERVINLFPWPGTVTSTTRHIRLEGETNITAALAAETDTTTATASFLVPFACYWLLQQQQQGKGDRQGRPERMQMFLSEAQAAKAELTPFVRHSTRRRVRVP